MNDEDLQPDEHDAADDDIEVQARKRWSDGDDLILLIQVNNDRPFLAERHMTRAWEFLAEKVLAVDGFSRPALDGKKASNRFTLLVKQHLVYQKTSKYLSGVNQDETEKDILLDELTALYTDNDKSKTQKKALEAAKRTVREVGAKFVRDEAMSRASRRQSQEPSDTDAPTSGKKRLLMEIQ
ncbi:hypothetical protein As57867_007839, partial [Aphanomyces stellatus]